jgi:DNA-directed RNA polymerase subunit E'/Rpb7
MTTNIINPFKNLKQYTRICVPPNKLNSDIRNNIKSLLETNLEGRCNKNGFITKIHRIIDYSDGFLIPETLNGNVMYNITYLCNICIPIENTVIIAQVKIINQELIIAINGPIMIFIPKENVDINTWNITDGYINKENKKKLQSLDYILVEIIDKRINANELQIKTIGKLLNYASEDDINKYFKTDNIEETNYLDI